MEMTQYRKKLALRVQLSIIGMGGKAMSRDRDRVSGGTAMEICPSDCFYFLCKIIAI